MTTKARKDAHRADVLALSPGAVCRWSVAHGRHRVIDTRACVIGSGVSAHDAWADAAERLQSRS